MDELIKILKKEKRNEWVSGIVPGLLFHMCLSIIYCWSLVKINIDSYVLGNTSWAFSIMVCVLAMTAILTGKYVERHTKDAARYGAVLFSLGMVGSGLSCQLDSLFGLYLFFGVCLGIGAGLIYEVPLKMISKWFRGGHKGFVAKTFMILSTLSSFIMVPSVKSCVESHGIVSTFTIFGIACLSILMLASWFIEDPENLKTPEKLKIDKIKRFKRALKDFHELPGFVALWFILFINLSAGLAVISCERDLLLVSGFSVIFGMGMARMSMPVGKGLSSRIMGHLEPGNTHKAWWIIYGLNILATVLATVLKGHMWLAVILINLGYGASFAIQPRLLADLYGKRKVSKTHPLLLTAWAAAGLFGSQIGDQIYISGGGPSSLMIVLGLIYIIGFGLSLIFKWIYKVESKEKENG